MMKKLIIALILIVFLSVAALYAAQAMQHRYAAVLSGQDEVPPVKTISSGDATFEVSADMTKVHYKITVHNVMNPTEAHIHMGIKGTNGPILVWLYKAPKHAPKKVDGILSQGTFTKADLGGPLKGKSIKNLIDEISKHDAYANVHTKQHAPGELRGWIGPVAR